MAKVKSPLFNELRGTLESNKAPKVFKTYSDKRKIVLLSEKPIPTDRKTEAQLSQRNLFRQAIDAWKQLSDEEKQQYKQQAAAYSLTGYQYFIKQFLLNPPPAEQAIWLEEFNEMPTAPPYDYVDIHPDIYIQDGKLVMQAVTVEVAIADMKAQLPNPITAPFKAEVYTIEVPHYISFQIADTPEPTYYALFEVGLDPDQIQLTFNDGTGDVQQVFSLPSRQGGLFEFIVTENSMQVLINGTKTAEWTGLPINDKQFNYFTMRFMAGRFMGWSYYVDYFKIIKL